jgi:hypothetical protein
MSSIGVDSPAALANAAGFQRADDKILRTERARIVGCVYARGALVPTSYAGLTRVSIHFQEDGLPDQVRQ